MAKLPRSVREIADVIGRERALYLVGQLPACGRRPWRRVIYIPRRIRADHRLVELLGWQDAKRLADRFAGEILQPANCGYMVREHRDEKIREMSRAGESFAVIANLVGLTERRVRGILSSEKTPQDENPRQPDTRV